MKKLLLGMISTILAGNVLASTIGVSSHPFVMNKHIVTTEFNSYLADGEGNGLNVKYMNRLYDRINLDAGIGFTDGDRSSNMIVGADLMLIPDYGRQPRVSVKGILETQKKEGERINSFGVAPTLSKGFSFWGKEAFPFIALPVKIGLNSNERTYETSTAVALGITGRIPFAQTRDLVGNIETNFSLRNSYASIVMGVSLPIQ